MAAVAVGRVVPGLRMHDGVVAALDAVPAARRGPSRSSGRRPTRSRRPGGPPRAAARGRRRTRGPTTAACRARRGARGRGRAATPVRGASSARATRCRSLAWTPTGPDQADEMEGPPPSTRAPARREQGRPLEERAVGDRGVDARQVLEDRPSRPEVEVADLGVAHLARRQADSALRGAERRVRPACEQAAPGGHRGGGDRVGGRVAADAEPVEDDEDDRARPAGRGGGHAAARRARAVSAGAGHDPRHLVGLQRGAADERAVDGGLGEELPDVRGRDAAAVQDRGGIRAAAPSRSPRARPGSRRPSRRRPARSRSGPCRSPTPAHRR